MRVDQPGGHNAKPDFKQFEHIFKRNFPGMESIPWGDLQDVNSIEAFVKNTLGNVFKQSGLGGEAGLYYKSDVFETHDRVIVKIYISDAKSADQFRLMVKSTQVKLEDFFEKTHHTIKLPSPIQPKSARAKYRDGVLQISARKLGHEDSFREIVIQTD